MPPGRATTSTECPFTLDLPTRPDIERRGDRWMLEVDGSDLELSNLDKVFWPDRGITKGDLVSYYLNVAPWILPHVAGRPLTMKRMPDGIDGGFFYQKNAPDHASAWVPRCAVEPEDGDTDNMVMIEHPAHLVYVANLGCVEIHPVYGRCERYDYPDYMVFDLDPFPPAGFDDVLDVAGHVRVVLEHLGLEGFPKTTGATGVHIYVPVANKHTYAQTRTLADRIGRMIRRAAPDVVTMEWAVSERTGVFIDHNMNRRGASLASVYSVRPRPGASVSAPVTWDEVLGHRIRPEDFTMTSIFDRLESTGDLFSPVADGGQDLDEALETLGVAAASDEDHGRVRRRIPVGQ